MDRWERIQKPVTRRGYDYPSFSSSLLDSIYRSIDDEARLKTDRRAPDPPPPKLKAATTEHRWAPPQPVKKHDRSREPCHIIRRQDSSGRKTYYSSSSDSSSYGFSSEPESATVSLNRLKPIKTVHTRPDTKPPLVPVQQSAEKKKKNLNIRSRFKELKKSRSPTSPAAKLAGFLNSLFTKRNNRAGCTVPGEESTCSSASSFTRSCLAKTPSDHSGKRSVRFDLPADIKNEKMMMWQDFEREEDDDVLSDASSDLFELAVVGKYRDELPVYETTYLGRLVL